MRLGTFVSKGVAVLVVVLLPSAPIHAQTTLAAFLPEVDSYFRLSSNARLVVSRVGFIVTNLEMPSRAVVRFYNKRGTAEQWIKEGKQAVKMTRLSCHRFRSNEVRLALSLLAYNLGNLWRLVLPQRIENWSLTRTRP